jgi:fluoroacetyl-CoA thioesterase
VGSTGGIVPVVPRSSSEAPAQLDPGLTAGLCASVELAVTDADTALALGSGDVPVLGTPRLVALCEEASCRAIDGHLGPGRTTVASRIQFDHLAPVPVGSTVTAEATLERVEGRRLVYTISVRLRSDAQAGLVGAGRLTRVLVDRAKFMAKAAGAACD